MSKTEVSNAQYVEFLNAVAKTDSHGLYDPFMGILQSGVSGSYTYSLKPDAVGQGPGGGDYSYDNKPVTHVSFFDAMRFVNWLENDQPIGTQALGTTEDGVYLISDGVSEVRSPNARYFIPREDEWYKAAFHKNDGVTGNYWDYPTESDLVPDNNLPSADTGNSANHRPIGGGFTTGNPGYPLTDVGAYLNSQSSYGTFDQGGNLWEMTETLANPSTRIARGGYYSGWSDLMAASYRSDFEPTFASETTGFRVASIPEPSTLLLVILGAILASAKSRRG